MPSIRKDLNSPHSVMPPMCLQSDSNMEGSHPSPFPSRAPHRGINDVFVKHTEHLTNRKALGKLVWRAGERAPRSQPPRWHCRQADSDPAWTVVHSTGCNGACS